MGWDVFHSNEETLSRLLHSIGLGAVPQNDQSKKRNLQILVPSYESSEREQTDLTIKHDYMMKGAQQSLSTVIQRASGMMDTPCADRLHILTAQKILNSDTFTMPHVPLD